MQLCNIKERSTVHIQQVYCTHKANEVNILFELYENYNFTIEYTDIEAISQQFVYTHEKQDGG